MVIRNSPEYQEFARIYELGGSRNYLGYKTQLNSFYGCCSARIFGTFYGYDEKALYSTMKCSWSKEIKLPSEKQMTEIALEYFDATFISAPLGIVTFVTLKQTQLWFLDLFLKRGFKVVVDGTKVESGNMITVLVHDGQSNKEAKRVFNETAK